MIASRLASVFVVLVTLSATAQVRLLCPEANFSIAAPAGWTWEAAPASQRWSVVGPRGDRFTVHIVPSASQKVPEIWIRGMLPGIARDAATRGERIEHVMHASASAPVFPSIRYAYTRVAKNGQRTFVDGYVAARGQTYAIEYTSVSREFLPEFWSFVRSFQVLDKFASQRTARASQAAVTPAAVARKASDVLGRPLGPNQVGGCSPCAQ
ncbi:MAG TPA: hypothetical protein VGQ76_17535 [Thermoanaerobaculia bacterium]|jgi:hypothetical protein|nr:hypothetical protein [Thermoanaerobaculia bacterium]